MITFIMFVITISILVAVHEFGHFWVARRCGIKVERFSIGFGPILLKRCDRRGTEFALSAIPLGGYVKMRDSRVDTLTQEQQKTAFDKQSIAKRAAVLSAGPIANFILAILLYWLINMLGVAMLPVKIDHILPNSIMAQTNIPAGSQLVAINKKQVESWQDVQLALVEQIGKANFQLSFIPPSANMVEKRTINIDNWQVDLDQQSPIEAIGIVPQALQAVPIIKQVVKDSPAAKAGLQVGDEILSYNQQPLKEWQAFTDLIKTAQPISLKIKRQQQIQTLILYPQPRYNSQTKSTQGFAGILPSSNVIIKKYGIIEGFSKGVAQTTYMIKLTVRSFYQLITGALSIKNLSGPVSIAKSANQSASYGIVPYLYFLAFISISLGVINLVPLPMLDGGHLLFLVIEKIKGRPLSEATQAIFYRISFALLLTLMGLALFNDFSRL